MAALAAVIPLHGNKKRAAAMAAERQIPEPAQLYGLTVLAFLLHDNRDGFRTRCHEPWPCDHLRLAYRLREGF